MAEFTESLFSIFFIETLMNGLLLGGILALLSIGLNLIFGVIDVVWICYAEIIMVGMYLIFYLNNDLGFHIIPSMIAGILFSGLVGWLTHKIVISRLIDAAPINQLIATGGLLFFFQGAAMIVFGIEFRNMGMSLGSLALSEDIYLSWTRLLSFAISGVIVVGLYFFLSKSYLGAAIRAISQDKEIMSLMGVDTKKLYLLTSAIGGALAGLAACLLVLQYDVHPFIGLSFGPITFIICVMGGLGNMVGGFVAAFIFSELITIGGYFAEIEWGYVLAFVFFIVMMFIRPEGLFARKS
ncbi:MAG: branched-chain amino acid ABC transporter permease [Marinovum sp.]|jgi:branched-chain amino acid transport system permease protein|nr:branched-chain amino acid ABC transporter permease [Marinovum sp.]|tara:strand:+ start:502 stop:1389 length:888 start_codon:yes stop_codon:yes gene_type:complete